ncbi:hypothetical protein SARC_01459 [Sphaeroforma arctica JP610]|uniref:Choline/carnitine acyltransferase domain-containing protein n=1 Tax=Sphaeroforma arctica JP610 TaxID=667725 RepID=A0A0L0GBX5_9EUKA|nr:hypothetical protein SARC_01459 [Sphaeroforma arctica JP610]KNC86409.1 hypothetical protein SARC_01459 [Sphaeroforma arctica JP610]|eukprot:XP_014160311.1 hypothetical protein SARC_01459 [Sphaeroforma arctica JP610]
MTSTSNFATYATHAINAAKDLTIGSGSLRMTYVNFVTGPWTLLLFPFHVLRVALLRTLLTYNGWTTRPHATSTMVYFLVLKLLVMFPVPTFQSLQKSMPCLPVPSLKESCDQFITSVEPLLTPEQLQKTKDDLQRFQTNGTGQQLQSTLQYLYWSKDNWLSDIWLRAAYLMTREFLPCAASWYSSDLMPYLREQHTKNQAERSATLIYATLNIRDHVLNKRDFEGLYTAVAMPLCMNGYQDTFGTTRVPKKGEDFLEHHPQSSYITVLCQNFAFKVEVVHKDGSRASVKQLQHQFEYVMATAKAMKEDGVEPNDVCVLTSQNRDVWADEREALIQSSAENAQKLHTIESSAIVLSLDHESPVPRGDKKNLNLDEYATAMQHNHGQNRWFDKSMNIITFPDGYAAVQFEHSFADGSVNGHLWEAILLLEARMYKHVYSRVQRISAEKKKKCPVPIHDKIAKENARQTNNRLDLPTAIQFDLTPRSQKACQVAQETIKRELKDVSQGCLIKTGLGKSHFKKLKMSPDAFLQMALQLAHRRVMGYYTLTYEPVSMRAWRLGRTETNRVLSNESKKFCDAMIARETNSADAPTSAETISLLKAAEKKHVNRIRSAMFGKGVDRHIMSMKIVAMSQGLDIKDMLDGPAFTLPWGLVTTTTPLLFGPKYKQLYSSLEESVVTVGGGFTSYQPDSLGMAYFFYDDGMSFHTTVRVGDKIKDAEATRLQFQDAVVQAMDEIYALHKE